MKTKYAQGAQRISMEMGDTSKPPVSVKLPAVAAVGLPPMASEFMGAGMAVNPNATAPVQTQDTQSLPMFSATAGYTDTGAAHAGDLGGAA